MSGWIAACFLTAVVAAPLGFGRAPAMLSDAAQFLFWVSASAGGLSMVAVRADRRRMPR